MFSIWIEIKSRWSSWAECGANYLRFRLWL